MSKEMKPGEVRKANNRKYKAEISTNNCSGCAFDDIMLCEVNSDRLGHCCKSRRSDGEYVIFVDVTDQED